MTSSPLLTIFVKSPKSPNAPLDHCFYDKVVLSLVLGIVGLLFVCGAYLVHKEMVWN